MYEGLYDTRQGLSEPDAELIGAMTTRLLFPWDRWVYRRVEHVTFCDEDSVRRDISIDFTLPNWFHDYRGTEPHKPRRQLVPLGFLRKGVLVNFSLRDECNASLPLLITPQNAQVASATLIHLARIVIGTNVPEQIRCDIKSLVRDPPIDAAKIHHKLLTEPDSAHAARKLLSQNSNFLNAVSLFRDHFLALSMVDIARFERRVLHLSYEEIFWDITWLRQLARGWSLALGAPRILFISVPSASATASYHLEVEAPDGIMITRRESYYRPSRSVPVERYTASGGYKRAHFHFSNVATHSEAAAALHLRPRSSSVIRGATLTALLALIATVTIANRLPHMSGDTATATTLLLAATGLVGFIVIRSGESEIATSLLLPLRVLAILPVVLAVVAAIVVVAQLGLSAEQGGTISTVMHGSGKKVLGSVADT